jgi:Ca2+/Na+ antiporter
MEHLKTLFVWTPLSILVVLFCAVLVAMWIIRVRRLEGAARHKRAASHTTWRLTIRRRPPAAKALRRIAVMALFAGMLIVAVAVFLISAADGTHQTSDDDLLLALLCVGVASSGSYLLARIVEAGARVRARKWLRSRV